MNQFLEMQNEKKQSQQTMFAYHAVKNNFSIDTIIYNRGVDEQRKARNKFNCAVKRGSKSANQIPCNYDYGFMPHL